jgi:hypothetical protein
VFEYLVLAVLVKTPNLSVEMSSSAILEGRFALGVKSKRIYVVTIDSTAVRYTSEAKSVNRPLFKVRHRSKSVDSCHLLVKDIIGCDCRKGTSSDDSDHAAYLVVCAYPTIEKSHSTDANQEDVLNCRRRTTLTVKFNSHSTFDQNLAEAMKWKAVVSCLAMKVKLQPTTGLLIQYYYRRCRSKPLKFHQELLNGCVGVCMIFPHYTDNVRR